MDCHTMTQNPVNLSHHDAKLSKLLSLLDFVPWCDNPCVFINYVISVLCHGVTIHVCLYA